jgi:hypothetical protein
MSPHSGDRRDRPLETALERPAPQANVLRWALCAGLGDPAAGHVLTTC